MTTMSCETRVAARLGVSMVMVSSQASSSETSVMQLPALHQFTVHSFSSSQSIGSPTQLPSAQVSPVVHASPSSQLASLKEIVQVPSSQVASVQGRRPRCMSHRSRRTRIVTTGQPYAAGDTGAAGVLFGARFGVDPS